MKRFIILFTLFALTPFVSFSSTEEDLEKSVGALVIQGGVYIKLWDQMPEGFQKSLKGDMTTYDALKIFSSVIEPVLNQNGDITTQNILDVLKANSQTSSATECIPDTFRIESFFTSVRKSLSLLFDHLIPIIKNK